MGLLSVVICHAAADDAFYHAYVAGLKQANVEVIGVDYGVSGLHARPLEEAELQAAPVFVVLLSPAALSSPRVRSETRRYIELQADDLARMVLPVVIEPIEPDAIWPFLQPYRRAAGMAGAHLSAEALVRGTLRALGTYVDPYETLVPESLEEERQLNVLSSAAHSGEHGVQELAPDMSGRDAFMGQGIEEPKE